jgi:LytR cell envelope-related transcriptional attenuator
VTVSLPAAEVVDLPNLIEHLPAVVSVVAAVGIALLLPLYRSQRRDVLRLRAWMEQEPDHPATDIAASEALLDRAEAELERLTEPEAEADAAQATPVPAATRVTSERPALTRITMERAALEPHPRWRRFVGRVTQPRILIAIGVGALLIGVGGIFVSEKVLEDGGGGSAKTGKIDKSSVNVAVLNGTAITGLGGKVGGVVEENGYSLGTINTTPPGVKKTEVLYAPHNKAAAQKVAKDLGIDPGEVKPLDRDARQAAGPEADVVVIAGEDRARS